MAFCQDSSYGKTMFRRFSSAQMILTSGQYIIFRPNLQSSRLRTAGFTLIRSFFPDNAKIP
jgi:hypothetical protein